MKIQNRISLPFMGRIQCSWTQKGIKFSRDFIFINFTLLICTEGVDFNLNCFQRSEPLEITRFFFSYFSFSELKIVFPLYFWGHTPLNKKRGNGPLRGGFKGIKQMKMESL